MVGLSDFPGCRSSCVFSSHKNTEHQILTVEAAQSFTLEASFDKELPGVQSFFEQILDNIFFHSFMVMHS